MIGAFVLALLLNFFIPGYDKSLNYIFCGGLFFSIALYHFFKKDRYYNSLKLILIVLIWSTFNISWFFNHGFNRSVIILFAFFFTFLIFVQNHKGIIICTILMAINLGALLLIDTKWPELIAGEMTPEQEKVDIIYTLVIGWLLIPSYVLIAKNRYLKEYHKARQSEELKTSFLANMSHEIRTPLNAIMGFSELIKEDEDLRYNEKYIDLIYTNGQYLHELIDQVLNISLIESGSLTVQNRVVDLSEFLRRMETEGKMLIERAQKRGIEIRSVLSEPDLKIVTDLTQLEQVFKNLITNAIKFTSEGEIVIEVRYTNQIYHFSITDTGEGIAPEKQKSVFERFVKLSDFEHSRSKGAGLGLYLCRQIVEKLGGEISVQSIPKKGSRFQFTLPGEKP